MTQITREGLAHQPDEHGEADGEPEAVVASTDGTSWRTRVEDYSRGWHGWRGRATAWSGLAALGLTIGFVHAKVFEGGSAAPVAGTDKGVATAPAVPGGAQSPNTGTQGNANVNISPTPSSGGFNNAAGGAALTCTDVRIVPLGGSKYNVIPVVSGDTSGADLYTVAVNDNDTREHKKGIAWLPLDSSVNTSFPQIMVVNLDGTGASPSDLDGPLGGSFPDSHIYDCPVTAYPGN